MKKLLYLLALAALPLSVSAQDSDDDFGIWTSIGAEKKINKKLSVEAEAEFRTRNSSKTADRWTGSIDVSYKIFPWLKASGGYKFIYNNNQEKITYHTDGSYNNWRPSFWGTRHRFHIDLTGDIDLGRFNLSLRERWQYTYRPEATTTRYDFDNSKWEDTTVSGKGKNVLRSRLQAKYNIPHSKITPYANVELFNAWSLQKVRYTLGADWKLSKQHEIGAYYRYQHVNDDDEPNGHILGLSYKFKF
ncbi:MAG: DUF2490 domain-containing protein [Bacteroidaceae bacterium]|nr:DUF2490 domain-containing protein [Bacteroidaceae bacterium]